VLSDGSGGPGDFGRTLQSPLLLPASRGTHPRGRQPRV
jgi:hypothetical protein